MSKIAVIITDMFGKQVAQLDIPQNNVIPEAIRKADATWKEKSLFGRYTATVVANYGTSNKQSITAVTNFTVFPWKKALLIGGIILILLIILIRSRERLKRAFHVLIGKY